jgi:hypothetical protein
MASGNGKMNQKKALVYLLENNIHYIIENLYVSIYVDSFREDKPIYVVDIIDLSREFDEVGEAVDYFLEKISETA